MPPVTAICLLAARGSVVQAAVVLVVIPVLYLALMVWAIMDLSRRRTVTWGNKWIWAVIIVLFGMIGPVVYLVAGRPQPQVRESGDEEARRGAGAAQRAAGAADVLYGPAGQQDDVATGETAGPGRAAAPDDGAPSNGGAPQGDGPAAGDDAVPGDH